MAVRAFAWRPKQVPLKKWNIVRGDQVSFNFEFWFKRVIVQVEVISGRYKKSQG